ncbi:NADH oxidase [Streptomyces sp. NPDC049577]|uniref:NADH oxidase n=1 Tax=Streptomyces sp. NPDC049577 TaxID=3155153 RepID=UPI003412E639
MSISTAHRVLHLWSLCEDVVVEHGAGENELVLRGRWGAERIDRPAPAVREALRRMELGPVLLTNVGSRSEEAASGAATCLVLMPVVSRLSHLVVRTLSVDDLKGPLLSVSPLARDASFSPVPLPPRLPVRLPEDASLTVQDTGFALESSVSPHQVLLHRPEAAWVVAMLAWSVTPHAASAALPLPPKVTEEILSYLAAAGMVAPVRDNDRVRLRA